MDSSEVRSSPDFIRNQFKAFNRMRSKKELCDVTIIVNNIHHIYAHRVLLAAYSEYFLAMFSNDMLETRLGVLNIDGIKAEIMDQLIDVAYGKSIQIDDDNITEMLMASNRLQIEAATIECCDYLISSLDPTNCLGILKFARISNCTTVISAANRYCWRNFTEIIMEEEFLLLNKDEVRDYLSDDNLHVKEEAVVLNAALRWLLYDRQQRDSYKKEILDCIRFTFIGKEEISSVATSLGNSSFDVIEFIGDYLSHKSNTTNKPAQRHYTSAIMVIGRTSPSKCCLRYNVCSHVWVKMSYMLADKLNSQVVHVDGKLYVVSSTPATSDNIQDKPQCLECYDPEDKSWTIATHVPSPRWQCSVISTEENIYFIGGYNFLGGFSHLDDIDCYSPQSNNWTKVANLSTRRRGSCAAYIDGVIYVIGGHDGTRILSTCECYEIANDAWQSIEAMKVPRESHKAVVLDGLLYVVGGITKSGYTKCVECYDPKQKHWKCCANAPLCHPRQQLVCLNNRLYLLSNNDEYPVVCFNPVQNKWYKSNWPKFGERYKGGTVLSCLTVEGL